MKELTNQEMLDFKGGSFASGFCAGAGAIGVAAYWAGWVTGGAAWVTGGVIVTGCGAYSLATM
ncbi:hypothetical protein [Flammeovirga pacifica]|uniref:Bacteriocin n=1 Tax=Flammeovirga pacifica TaxID=915059 RepID=A0A1S1Z1Q8_FLAPC|nr:hypothetical protein [Flammeovirga pacifica]OHX67113.1 hypothetical protein NH26_12555 [Flammeovirga pacifica]